MGVVFEEKSILLTQENGKMFFRKKVPPTRPLRGFKDVALVTRIHPGMVLTEKFFKGCESVIDYRLGVDRGFLERW